jgi:hypothetical protein
VAAGPCSVLATLGRTIYHKDNSMTEMKKPRLRHSVKIGLLEFLRPGGCIPHPYSVEMTFQALRWLLASGVGYSTQHEWHKTSVSSLLGGSSADYSYPKPVQSIRDLLSRFHAGILSSETFCPEVGRWRADKGIHAYAEIDMDFLHYKPMASVPHLGFDCEDAVSAALNSLFVGAAGKQTSVSLNSVHHKAQTIHGVDVTISPTAFYFTLRYGFHTPEDMQKEGDSEWPYTLAHTKPATGTNHHLPEPFLDTLRRALDEYAFVTDPKNGHLMKHLHNGTFVDRVPDPYWSRVMDKDQTSEAPQTA